MFIAHLPVTYLALRTLAPRTLPPALFCAVLLGGIAPDVDLVRFYLIDNRQHHHHGYLSHRPALWFCLLVIGLMLRRARLSTRLQALAAGALLHLSLDSITGEIAWAWPLVNTAMPLVTVPARHGVWVMNFLTHWTFLIEIVLTLCALTLLWRIRKAAHPSATTTTLPKL